MKFSDQLFVLNQHPDNSNKLVLQWCILVKIRHLVTNIYVETPVA